MSSRIIEALKATNVKHGVRNLSEWNKKVLNQGAKVDGGNIDNFSIVELGFNTQGERVCKALTATTKKGVLIASVEEYIQEYEGISDFFNAEGELARIVYLEDANRIQVSAFVKDDGTKAIVNGQNVHFDATTKKYIVSNGTTDNAGFATAGNKFIVVDAEGDTLGGQTVITIETVR